MQRICHKCGNPAGSEGVFCEKCGTRLNPEDGDQNQHQNLMQNSYQNQYQYNPNQQNTPPYMPPAYPQQPIKKSGSKVLKGILIGVGAVMVILVALGIIGAMSNKDSETINKPGPNDTVQTSSAKPQKPQPQTPTENKQNPSANSEQSQASFNISVNAKAKYEISKKVFHVDYTATISNNGTKKADNVKLYFDPDKDDENAKYLYLDEKYLINPDGGATSIDVKSKQEIKITFTIDYIEPKDQSDRQKVMDDLQKRFIEIPVTIEWKEDGKPFVVSKVRLKPIQ